VGPSTGAQRVTRRCDWRGAPDCAEPAIAELVYPERGTLPVERRPMCRRHAMAIMEHCLAQGSEVPSLHPLTAAASITGTRRASAVASAIAPAE
jgi:hypothetical protein